MLRSAPHQSGDMTCDRRVPNLGCHGSSRVEPLDGLDVVDFATAPAQPKAQLDYLGRARAGAVRLESPLDFGSPDGDRFSEDALHSRKCGVPWSRMRTAENAAGVPAQRWGSDRRVRMCREVRHQSRDCVGRRRFQGGPDNHEDVGRSRRRQLRSAHRRSDRADLARSPVLPESDAPRTPESHLMIRDRRTRFPRRRRAPLRVSR